jgi:hypothetical protein
MEEIYKSQAASRKDLNSFNSRLQSKKLSFVSKLRI